MPAKAVLQHECERCPRTWYSPADANLAKTELSVTGTLAGTQVSVKYETLCETCTKTVSNLIAALGKEHKKSSPARRAKKETGGEANTSPPSDSTQPMAQRSALSGDQVVASGSVAFAGVSVPNGGGKSALTAPAHPKR